MAKRKTTVAILTALVLASIMLAAERTPAAASKGGKATKSARGNANVDAQWSADPERGWVRAGERRQLHKDPKDSPKRNHVIRKGNTEKKTSE